MDTLCTNVEMPFAKQQEESGGFCRDANDLRHSEVIAILFSAKNEGWIFDGLELKP